MSKKLPGLWLWGEGIKNPAYSIGSMKKMIRSQFYGGIKMI